jgi:hypothetical protein
MSKQYLAYIREINKAKASKCHICKKQSTGINAYKHEIKFVCNEHLRREADVILDTSINGVIHYIYPNGKKPGLMDPNIGGWRMAEVPSENSPE